MSQHPPPQQAAAEYTGTRLFLFLSVVGWAAILWCGECTLGSASHNGGLLRFSSPEGWTQSLDSPQGSNVEHSKKNASEATSSPAGQGSDPLAGRSSATFARASPYNFSSLSPALLAATQLVVGKADKPSVPQLVATHAGFNGGLADRLRGLAAMAVAALLSSRQLRVEPELLLGKSASGSGVLNLIDDGNCGERMVNHNPGSTVRVNTNCLMKSNGLQAELDKRRSSLPPATVAAAETLIAACGGVREVAIRDTAKGFDNTLRKGVYRSYECGALLLHAVAAEHRAELNELLGSVQGLFRAWQTALAPAGYTALHLRTGKVALPLASGVSLPSVAWKDNDMSSGRPPQWLNAAGSPAMNAFAARKHKPVAVASDSAVLIGLLQGRLWDSLRPMHCCVGAAHVARAHLGPDDDWQNLQQELFDLAVMGNAERLFVGGGGFWALGVRLWGMASDPLLFTDNGPDSSLPHFA